MDYLAYDRTRRRVWVPAGNTASVDVVDVTTERVTRIEGFSTAEMERHGTKRIFGPSSAAVGVGAVYVGNRGDSGSRRRNHQVSSAPLAPITITQRQPAIRKCVGTSTRESNATTGTAQNPATCVMAT